MLCTPLHCDAFRCGFLLMSALPHAACRDPAPPLGTLLGNRMYSTSLVCLLLLLLQSHIGTKMTQSPRDFALADKREGPGPSEYTIPVRSMCLLTMPPQRHSGTHHYIASQPLCILAPPPTTRFCQPLVRFSRFTTSPALTHLL